VWNVTHYQSVAGRCARIFAPLDRERQILGQFPFHLPSPECLPGGKTVNVPNSKDGFNVFSCSQYDGRGGLNHRCDVVNSGRACVHCDDCASRYYNQEARIA